LDLDKLKDLLDEFPDSDDVLKYFQMLDDGIPTEDILQKNKLLIVLFVLQHEEGGESDDDSDYDEVIALILAKKAASGL
jgi:hypothetical protein